uniref:Uncharacterized protein n=1 Tax=Anguilla anguilla TaxID=7936 RepID=A0A0E9RGH3_ANGAN
MVNKECASTQNSSIDPNTKIFCHQNHPNSRFSKTNGNPNSYQTARFLY